MFTGIITHKGTVTTLAHKAGIATLGLSIPGIKAEIGQSIAINGVCLTVVKVSGSTFSFEVVGETLKLTTLGALKVGSKVNCEKSLKLGDELDGSFVLGHVDAKTELIQITKSGKNTDLTFTLPKEIKKFVAQKGGIVIDGVALTVTKVSSKSFSVTIIPHTLKATTLGLLTKDSWVNLEADVIARYVVNAL